MSLIRTELLLGADAMRKIAKAKIALFGLGGVGSWTAMALVRSGVENFILVDSDTVEESNINRQLVADTTSIGKKKTDVMRDIILKINPSANILTLPVYFDEKTVIPDFNKLDYIIDAIDSIKSKIELICRAKENGINIISSMGAGNKLDGSMFKVADISGTSVCPLAKIMRRQLKEKGITELKVVFSKEPPKKNNAGVVGSAAFVTPVAGLLLAGEVIRDIAGIYNDKNN